MDQYSARIEELSKKAEKLVRRYGELKETCAKLELENQELKEALEARTKQVEDLDHDLRVVKVAKQLSAFPDEEKQELKKKINEYIKEIDKCVALLND